MNVIFWNSLNGGQDLLSRYVGPYKVNHWIKKHGYTGQVIDFLQYLTEDEIVLSTKKFITDETLVLGISTTFLTYNTDNKDGLTFRWKDGTKSAFPENILKAAYRLKKEYPHIKFVLGGYASDHVYGGPIFDAVIMNYTEASEDIFLEYLDHLKKGTEPPLSKMITKYSHIAPGIPVTSRIHYHEARNKVYNIEHDDFRFSKQDAVLPGETLPLDISRGCIFACRFCNYPHLGKGKLDYTRGMEYVKEELISNYELFGVTRYMILDDTFNDTVPKMEAFLAMTESLPFKIEYSAYIRADLIDRFPDTAYMMQESGLWGAFHGLESLHPYASNLVGKAWSGKKAKDFIPKLYHDLWGKKVPQLLSFICGLPKETPDDIMNTLKWHKENNLHGIFFAPLGLNNPNKSNRYSIKSEFETNAEKYGFKFNDNAWHTNGWVNETWTDKTSRAFLGPIYKYLNDNNMRRASPWVLGNLQLLGYDKEYLFNIPLQNLDNADYRTRLNNKYREYYNLLMRL
jgi:radical SAM superfamily enzyme YgiQ (UPF0313 family)